MYDDIRYVVENPVALITLDRPDSLNAWTDAMGAEVEDALRRAAADPRVVGIVITGAGRAFCAGADMKVLQTLSGGSPSNGSSSGGSSDGEGGGGSAGDVATETSPADPEDDFGGRFPSVMAIDKPVIAAVNGAVAGMAYPFVLCCDLRIVSPDALFLTAFAQRGLIAEWGLSWLLPRLVGPAVALDLLFSSRRVGGEEAVRLGLANELVPADRLVDHCRAYVEQLARTSSPASMAVMKRQVYEQLHRGLGAAEREAQRLMVESFARPDFAEGVRSFVEKRAPDFARLGAPDAPDA